MKTIKSILIIACITIGITACTKDGSMGPAGPTGATGAQGNTTMYIIKFSVDTTQWKGIDILWTATYKIAIPQLTPQAVSNGTVQVYYTKDTAINPWLQWSVSNTSALQSESFSTASDTLYMAISSGYGRITGKYAFNYNPVYFKVVILEQ
ncbi:MAG TPA: hypothetical protein VK806_12275 [Bacteroidia bacterium]|jgi:hypothetical protein|nr:hypothetical protein [Bacteroidia bacterium]